CPFCGGEASAEGMQIYNSPLSDTWWEDGSEITQAFFCNCIRCGISNVSGSVGHRTRDMAIAAWNRRAEAGQLCNSTVERAECAAFSAGYEAGERDGRARPMCDAPKDGTPVLVKIKDDLSPW